MLNVTAPAEVGTLVRLSARAFYRAADERLSRGSGSQADGLDSAVLRHGGPGAGGRADVRAASELPGGAVEADESPYAAASREVFEELSLTRPVGRLLAVDWVPPSPDRTESFVFVFDGGELSLDEVAALRVPPDELRGWAWCTADEAVELLPPLLRRRLVAALDARRAGEVAYLENGTLLAA